MFSQAPPGFQGGADYRATGPGAGAGTTKHMEKIEKESILCMKIGIDKVLDVGRGKGYSVNIKKTPAYVRLLAISQVYGVLISGSPDGIVMFNADKAARAISEDQGDADLVEFPSSVGVVAVDMKARGLVTHVGLSGDSSRLFVAVSGGKLLMYDLVGLYNNPGAQPLREVSFDAEITDVRPNPASESQAVAVLLKSGEIVMFNYHTEMRSHFPKTETFTSMCWSPKGKQIACGTASGLIMQFTEGGQEKKRYERPPSTESTDHSDHGVLSLEWVETFVFLAMYGKPPGTSQSAAYGDESEAQESWIYIIQASKTSPPTYLANTENPLVPFGLVERHPQFYTSVINGWGESASTILFLSPADNLDTFVFGIGNGDEEKAAGIANAWCSWDLGEVYRVAQPLSKREASEDEELVDTGPLGLVVDYTNTIQVPPLDPEVTMDKHKPMPLLWVLNSDATLSVYRICNKSEALKGGACQSMVSSVKDISTSSNLEVTSVTSAHPPTGGAFGTSAKPAAPAPSPFGLSSGGTAAAALPFGTSISKPTFGTMTAVEPSAGNTSNAPVFGMRSSLGSSLSSTFGGGDLAASSSTGSLAFGSSSKFGGPGGISAFGVAAKSATDKAKDLFGEQAGNKGAGEGSFGMTSTSKPETGSTTTAFWAPAAEKKTAFDSLSKPEDNSKDKAQDGFKAAAAGFATAPSLISGSNISKPFETAAQASFKKQTMGQQENTEAAQQQTRAEAQERAKRRAEEQKLAAEMQYKEQVRQLIRSQYARTLETINDEFRQLGQLLQKSSKVISAIKQSAASSGLGSKFQWTTDDPSDPILPQRVKADYVSQLQFPSKEPFKSLAASMLDILRQLLQVTEEHKTGEVANIGAAFGPLETKIRAIGQIIDKTENSLSDIGMEMPSPHTETEINPFEQQKQEISQAYQLVSSRLNDLAVILDSWKDRLRYERIGQPRLQAPSFDLLNRTISNLTNTLLSYERRLEAIARRAGELGPDLESAERPKTALSCGLDAPNLLRAASLPSMSATPNRGQDSLIPAFSNIKIRQLSPANTSRVAGNAGRYNRDSSPFAQRERLEDPPSYAGAKSSEFAIRYIEQRNRRSALRSKLGASTRPVHILKCDIHAEPSSAEIYHEMAKLGLETKAKGAAATSRLEELTRGLFGSSIEDKILTPSLDRIYSELKLDKGQTKGRERPAFSLLQTGSPSTAGSTLAATAATTLFGAFDGSGSSLSGPESTAVTSTISKPAFSGSDSGPSLFASALPSSFDPGSLSKQPLTFGQSKLAPEPSGEGGTGASSQLETATTTLFHIPTAAETKPDKADMKAIPTDIFAATAPVPGEGDTMLPVCQDQMSNREIAVTEITQPQPLGAVPSATSVLETGVAIQQAGEEGTQEAAFEDRPGSSDGDYETNFTLEESDYPSGTALVTKPGEDQVHSVEGAELTEGKEREEGNAQEVPHAKLLTEPGTTTFKEAGEGGTSTQRELSDQDHEPPKILPRERSLAEESGEGKEPEPGLETSDPIKPQVVTSEQDKGSEGEQSADIPTQEPGESPEQRSQTGPEPEVESEPASNTNLQPSQDSSPKDWDKVEQPEVEEAEFREARLVTKDEEAAGSDQAPTGDHIAPVTVQEADDSSAEPEVQAEKPEGPETAADSGNKDPSVDKHDAPVEVSEMKSEPTEAYSKPEEPPAEIEEAESESSPESIELQPVESGVSSEPSEIGSSEQSDQDDETTMGGDSSEMPDISEWSEDERNENAVVSEAADDGMESEDIGEGLKGEGNVDSMDADESMLEIQADGTVKKDIGFMDLGLGSKDDEDKPAEKKSTGGFFSYAFDQSAGPPTTVAANAMGNETSSTPGPSASKSNLFRPAQLSFGGLPTWGTAKPAEGGGTANTSFTSTVPPAFSSVPAFGQTSFPSSGSSGLGSMQSQPSAPAFGQTSFPSFGAGGGKNASFGNSSSFATPAFGQSGFASAANGGGLGSGFAAKATMASPFASLSQTAGPSSIIGAQQPVAATGGFSVDSTKFGMRTSSSNAMGDDNDEEGPQQHLPAEGMHVPGLNDDSD